MSKQDILRIPDYLEHILEAIERIERYTEDVDDLGFLNDEKTPSSAILKSSARPRTIFNAIIPNLQTGTPMCLGL
jgi:hypothetical protein